MENVKYKKTIIFLFSIAFFALIVMSPVRAIVEAQMAEEIVQQVENPRPEVVIKKDPRLRDETNRKDLPLVDVQKETLRQLQIMNNTLLRIEQKIK